MTVLNLASSFASSRRIIEIISGKPVSFMDISCPCELLLLCAAVGICQMTFRCVAISCYVLSYLFRAVSLSLCYVTSNLHKAEEKTFDVFSSRMIHICHKF